MIILLHFSRMLTGSEGGQSRPEIDIPEILRVLDKQNIDWRGFLSHRGRIGEVDDVIARMRSGEVIHAASSA